MTDKKNYWERLERFLPLVNKPGRYTGNELNIPDISFNQESTNVVLAYPDVYEIGMSYTGFKILYEILNIPRNENKVNCERVFSPWPDMANILLEKKIPLLSLESKTPIKEFDLVGITLQYELNYSNIVWMLKLSEISILSSQRREEEPFIAGGGINAYNPEPVADFFDFFMLGDGERIFYQSAAIIGKGLREGKTRKEILCELSKQEGIYVPSFYEIVNIPGQIEGKIRIKKEFSHMPKTINKAYIKKFGEEFQLSNEIVPLIDIAHGRASIEIMRGCSHGCRFCNAGFLYRPLREKGISSVLKEAGEKLGKTGWDQVGLLSLASCDYHGLKPLLDRLTKTVEKKHVTISMPSSRIDNVDFDILKQLKGERKSGLTFAPEAGTYRLRKVINKNIKDEQIFDSIDMVFKAGWSTVKLYFMIGLPTESDEDIVGMAEMINKSVKIAKSYGKDRKINITVSPFIPKAHTPFQWEKQIGIDELKEKIHLLRKHIRNNNALKLNWRDAEVAYLEGVFARGGRNLGKALLKVIDHGVYYDGWTDFFSLDKWNIIFQEAGIDAAQYLNARIITEELPWDHINTYVKKEFLQKEYYKAYEEEVSEDCREKCEQCGACNKERKIDVISREEIDLLEDDKFGRKPVLKKTSGVINKDKVRLQFTKIGTARFISHLDLFRLFDKVIRKIDFPLSYSQGYTPHPKIALGPPLSIGIAGKSEYVDLQLEKPFQEQYIRLFNKNLPKEVQISKSKLIYNKTPALNAAVDYGDYRVLINPVEHFSFIEEIPGQEEFLKQVESGGKRLTEWLRDMISAWNNSEEILISRIRNDKEKILNLKELTESIELVAAEPWPMLNIRLKFGQEGSARIEEVLKELLKIPQQWILQFYIERTGLYIIKENELLTPMDV